MRQRGLSAPIVPARMTRSTGRGRPALRLALVIAPIAALGAWGAAVASAATLPAGCAQATPGGTVTCTYAAGGESTFAVPDGVSRITVEAIGAPGGAGSTGGPTAGPTARPGAGGAGAKATATVAVVPASTVYVEVGTPGGRAGIAPLFCGAGGAGGNGGGGGGTGRCIVQGGGGGGGGASGIQTAPAATAVLTATAGDPRLVVAGGGGGGGGAGTVGLGPVSVVGTGGAGGDAGGSSGGAGAGGAGSSCLTAPPSPNNVGGNGGAGGVGAGGGAGGVGSPAGAVLPTCRGFTALPGAVGTPGAGGAGASDTSGSRGSGAGGGGGGYVGGGAGGASSITAVGAGGGGGGSSFAPGGTVATAAVGAAPSVTISYTPPGPTTAPTTPIAGTGGGVPPTVRGRVAGSGTDAEGRLVLILSADGSKAAPGSRITAYTWSLDGTIISRRKTLRFRPPAVNRVATITLTVRASNGTSRRATFTVRVSERHLRATPRFAYNSPSLTAAGRATLTRLARRLNLLVGGNPQTTAISVTGHASASIDPFGAHNPANELRLSRQRAQTTSALLARALKAAHPRLVVRWRGGDDPIASNLTLEGQALNRRVDVSVTAVVARLSVRQKP
jgi:outer membrane protein OmpA-like peptidoglycan-associated protein